MESKFELAPQEQLLFVENILNIFLDKVIDHPEALVTDWSKISDFAESEIEESIGKGKKPGHYLFKRKIWRRKNQDGTINLHKPRSNEDFKELIFEEKAIHYRKWIIRKTKRVFGVDITDYYEKDLPVILKHIMTIISKEKAMELGILND